MYQIYLNSDGNYHCQGRLQDGTERWIMPTLKQATKSMKRFAKNCNGVKIKKRDIEFYRWPGSVSAWVRFNPYEKECE